MPRKKANDRKETLAAAISSLDELSGKGLIGEMFDILYCDSSLEEIKRGYDYWAPKAVELREKHGRERERNIFANNAKSS